ncbi:hypothetical protein F2P81_001345 [Scophthalmus maximus]|uniref:Uncharacterized protein n=1 Tax=Scophthalmus maximus TaxID=52904 RepID=A0A6A4U072_SCOMX|nr:hypothetical protein F2P81_001345 [Scophthalmus maximus]
MLLRQWDHLLEKERVLYRQVFRSDGREEFLQLILPTVLKQGTLKQLHQENGHQGIEAPFFVVFGQEPRLPIGFLLGRVDDTVPVEIQGWVVEHQARLRVAFDSARDWLRAAAGWRKERHGHLAKVRTVHRDMLKAVVRPEPPASHPREPALPAVVVNDGYISSVGDLWLLLSGTLLPPTPASHSSFGPTGPPVVAPLEVGPHLVSKRCVGWDAQQLVSTQMFIIFRGLLVTWKMLRMCSLLTFRPWR